MNSVIDDIYRTRVVTGRSGECRALDESPIDCDEGAFLHQCIASRPTISQTLEVGCANGLSSLYICEALRDRPDSHHTIIDPLQTELFDYAGVVNLEKAEFSNFTLLEEPSETALPELLRSGRSFDFVFVDGFHTFDHTLIDCFYATKLLNVGGALVVDDCSWSAIRRAVSHLMTYPCYRFAGSVRQRQPLTLRRALWRVLATFVPSRFARRYLSPRVVSRLCRHDEESMVCLEKVAEDERTWNWHRDF